MLEYYDISHVCLPDPVSHDHDVSCTATLDDMCTTSHDVSQAAAHDDFSSCPLHDIHAASMGRNSHHHITASALSSHMRLAFRTDFAGDSQSNADQFILATTLKLRRCRAKCQKEHFDGPTARKDTEDSERIRWIQVLADLRPWYVEVTGKIVLTNPPTRNFWAVDAELPR